MSKACPRCGVTKPITEFTIHKGKPGDRETYCRSCISTIRKRRKQVKNPSVVPNPKQGPKSVQGFPEFFERYSGLGAIPPHALSWVEAHLENDNLQLNVPSKHAKTTIMAEWLTVWTLAHNRNAQILLISKTQPLAIRSARRIAQILEQNDQLIKEFGRFRPSDSSWPWRPESGELMIEGRDRVIGTGDFSLQARGSQQQVLGMEANLLIADDITDRSIAKSDANAEREIEWFRGECLSRLVGDGKALLIGQRVHYRDIYARLLDEDEETEERTWNRETYPAVLSGDLLKDEDDKIELLWPEPRRNTPNPLRWLRNQRKRLGAEMFDAYFQQRPWPDGQSGIRQEWIEGCLDDRPLGVSQFQPRERCRIISVDPSPARYAGIVVADLVPGVSPTIHVLETRRELDIGVEGLLRVLADLQLKYGANVCIVEMNSLRIILRDSTWQSLQNLFNGRVHKHSTTASTKQHETLGLWSMSSAWEFGRIRLPYGDDLAKASSDLLINEALGFSTTTDLVMALWFIYYNQNLANYQYNFSRPHKGGPGWGPAFSRSA